LVFEVLAGGEAVKLGFAMKKYNTKVGSHTHTYIHTYK